MSPLLLTFAVTFFNFIGQTGARVTLTLYALDLGAPASSVGIIGGLLFLFPLLLSWPIGALADRTGARGVLLFASFCGGVSLVIPYFVRELSALYVAAALNGFALAFYHVTLQNLIGVLTKPEHRARGFSNFSLTGATTNFVGPLLAGFAIDHSGHAVACLVIAAPSLAAIVLLLIWGRRFPPPKPAAPRDAGAPGLFADREVLRMLGISGLVQLGSDLFQFYLPVYGHSIGLSASAIGGILATLAVSSFIVRFFLPGLVKKHPPGTLLAWTFVLGAIGFALIPLFSHPAAIGAVAFCFGIGMGMGIPITVIIIFGRSVEGRSGQTLGLRLSFNNFVRVVGPMVFGVVGSAFGLSPVFWIAAAMMTAGGLISTRLRR